MQQCLGSGLLHRSWPSTVGNLLTGVLNENLPQWVQLTLAERRVLVEVGSSFLGCASFGSGMTPCSNCSMFIGEAPGSQSLI
jgi:hypothetical protein